jgi:hypothetical protein
MIVYLYKSVLNLDVRPSIFFILKRDNSVFNVEPVKDLVFIYAIIESWNMALCIDLEPVFEVFKVFGCCLK